MGLFSKSDEPKKQSHFFLNLVVAAILFVLLHSATGGGLYSMSADFGFVITNTFFGIGSGPLASMDTAQGIISMLITILLNIVVYYTLSAILVWFFLIFIPSRKAGPPSG